MIDNLVRDRVLRDVVVRDRVLRDVVVRDMVCDSKRCSGVTWSPLTS